MMLARKRAFACERSLAHFCLVLYVTSKPFMSKLYCKKFVGPMSVSMELQAGRFDVSCNLVANADVNTHILFAAAPMHALS